MSTIKILEYFNCAQFEKISHIIDRVLSDPKFLECSGSGKPESHHYGTGMLLQHTYEVVRYSLAAAEMHEAMKGERLRIEELVVAAVWHDYGKVWDYTLEYRQVENMQVWGKHNNHARRIHHVSRSAFEFHTFIQSACIPKAFDPDHVIHMILSHHGRREWGSPVSPESKEAWILHLSDNLSARLDDHATYPVS